MLDSVKIARRQSEIRQSLAELVGKETPTEEETRSMETLDAEYRTNETRYRAALVAEDEERREAGAELETRSDREWSHMMRGFEVRQVALAYAEGQELTGQTKEIVEEMRSHGGYRGIPVPFEALETRAGETIASGTHTPLQSMPITDRIFADSMAARMGCQMVQIPQGDREYPVVTSSVTAGWQATELGDVAGPTVFATTDRSLVPDYTLGITMKISRRALKQSGPGLEQAVRRDMLSTIQDQLDIAAFDGAGSSGEPAGVIADAATYGITETSGGGATWDDWRGAIVNFMAANAVGSPSGVKVMLHPQSFADLDATVFDSGSGRTEWDRLLSHVGAGNVMVSTRSNESGSPSVYKSLLTVRKNGVAPFVCGLWGGVDVIRDPFSDAASGGLRLTGLVTADFAVLRPAQLQVLTDLT
ncbi:phage major capsid protein [Ovoidimarina sediminis]|uniref:phage major capsid protein n=1 Tax=Ovoidimarina sediminis TaxID=3079856 RepID=UPI00291056A7|nr:phage major capsid protein [Rhodophyticola sp. MJ-SS7]MDU8946112.1 phage major capsid protein [Rhodophyticola sp. MJ-SS7]